MTGRVAHGRPFIFCFQISRGDATSGDTPYFIFEITKGRYRQGGRALVE